MATFVIGLLLAGTVTLIIRKMAKDRKEGKGGCGCGCGGCPAAGACSGARGDVNVKE